MDLGPAPGGALRDLLASLSGERLLYVPNPGNAGDSVIAAATYQMLDRLGLSYEVASPARLDPAGRVVLYGGGGNLVGPGTYAHRAVSRLHRRARRLIVLPHTVRDVDPLLDELGPNVTLVCRERVSHAYVRDRPGRRCEALLDHDLALSLDVALLRREGAGPAAWPALAAFLLNKPLGRGPHPDLASLRRALRPAVPAWLRDHPGGGVLDAFRLDGERTGVPIPERNADLSRIYAFGVSPAPVAHRAARALLGALDRFEEVRTNRLHLGISAALLGKRVLLHANNYYKIRAIWEFSLRDRFPKVAWAG